jgi:hypothetical protein
MKMKKKILALTLVFAFVLGQVSVFAEIKQPNPSLTPLQERLNMMNDVRENEDVQQEDILPEGFDQALLDEINNNPIVFTEETDVNEELSTAEELSETEEKAAKPSSRQSAPSEIEEEELLLLAAAGGIPDDFKVEPVGSVFNVLNNNNDYVSQATGALTYTKSLLSLPGANGLDLELSVIYNSSDAVITGNEFERNGMDGSKDGRKINFNSFAIGWSFGFPTIVISNRYGHRTEPYLRFPDGSGYEIFTEYYPTPAQGTTINVPCILSGYKLSDMALIQKVSNVNGLVSVSEYVLTYDNGRVITFDGTYGTIKHGLTP